MISMRGDLLTCNSILARHSVLELLLAVSVALSFVANAQSPASFRYTQTSGLTCNEIYDVLQDSKGFIWTATDRGVFRFDGYTFQSFTTAQGLTDNTVFCLKEDYRGRIWTLPFNGELCYIENEKVYPYRYNDTLRKYLPGMRIARTIDISPSGAIQVGYLIHGIIEISADGKFRSLITPDLNTNRHYWAVENDRNAVLMGTTDGNPLSPFYQYTFALSNNTFVQEFTDVPRRHHVAGIKRHNGTWCFAFGNYVIEINAAGQVQTTLLPFLSLCFFEDHEHCLWIGTEGQGARRYEPDVPVSGKYEDFFPDEIVTDIIEDAEQAFWIATHNNGLIYIPSIHVRSWAPYTNDKDEPISIIPGADGIVYTLWRDHGVTSINNGVALSRPFLLGKVGVYKCMTMHEDRKKIIIGTTINLLEFDPNTGIYTEWLRMGANSVNSGPEGIYVGAAWNLSRLTEEGKYCVIGDSYVRLRPDILFRDSKQQLWMGGLNGQYQVNDTTLISCAPLHPLYSQRIAGMCELNDGTLVTATQSNGIVFSKNGEIKVLDHSNQFSAEHIVSIAPGEQNSLWVSAKDGLYRITPGEKDFIIEDFPWLSGLLGNGGACYYDTNTHRLWLSNNNEILCIDPNARNTSTTGPRVYITDVFAHDSAVPPREKLELDHDENFLRISFAGLAFRLRGNVQYRYRFTGRHDEWKYTKQNTVELAALEPGNYVFEVEAENENGTWSSSPATFAFIIRPPYWRTWWFISTALLVMIVIGSLLIAYRFRSLRRRTLLREQVLVFRQQALASQMNPHFVFNAMNSIQSNVLKDNKTEALEMFSSFASLLRKSLQQANELYIPLNEEMSTLNLYFELEAMRFGEQLNYSVTADESTDPESISVPAMLVQPLAENAVIHGIRSKAEGGTVQVRFLMHNDQLTCEVDDNGVGRKFHELSDRTHKSVGMNITRDRLRVLGQLNRKEYKFDVIDKINPGTGEAEGTIVRFNMPFVNKIEH